MDVLSDGAAYLHGRRSNGFNDPPLLSSSLVSKADVALEEKGSETIGKAPNAPLLDTMPSPRFPYEKKQDGMSWAARSYPAAPNHGTWRCRYSQRGAYWSLSNQRRQPPAPVVVEPAPALQVSCMFREVQGMPRRHPCSTTCSSQK
ncbi:hypothetical protein VTN96DRAFT_2147 [Rasamsonia emersonii]